MHWFFSYSHQKHSNEDCNRFREELLACMRAKGWIESTDIEHRSDCNTIFIDGMLRTGGNWRIELLMQLDACDAAILFLTPDGDFGGSAEKREELRRTRSWIFFESSHLLARQYRQALPVFVAILVGTDIKSHFALSDDLLPLGNLQYLKFDPTDTKETIEKLVDKIKALGSESQAAISERDDRIVKEILTNVDLSIKQQALHDWVFPKGESVTGQEIEARLKVYLSKPGNTLNWAVASMLRSGPKPRGDYEIANQSDREDFAWSLGRIAYDLKQSASDKSGIKGTVELKTLWMPREPLMAFAIAVQKRKQFFVFRFDEEEGVFDTQGSSERVRTIWELLHAAKSLEPLNSNDLKVIDLEPLFETSSEASSRPKNRRLVQFERGFVGSIDEVVKEIAKALSTIQRPRDFLVVVDWGGWLTEPESMELFSHPSVDRRRDAAERRIDIVLHRLRNRIIPPSSEPERAIFSYDVEHIKQLIFFFCLPKRQEGQSEERPLGGIEIDLPIPWRTQLHAAIDEGMGMKTYEQR